MIISESGKKLYTKQIFSISLIVGFLPLQIIFLFFMFKDFGLYNQNRLLDIWTSYHLIPSVVSFIIFFILSYIYFKFKESIFVKISFLSLFLLYIILIIMFFVFESFLWGLSEL